MLGIVLFDIWKEHNQRRMQLKFVMKEQVLKQCIEMTGVGFDE